MTPRVPRATDRDPDLIDAIDLLPYAFVELGLDLSVTYASAGARELLGHQPAGIIGRSVVDLIHPDDVDRVTALVDALGDGDPRMAPPSVARHVEMPIRVRHADGRWIAVGATGRFVSADGPFFVCLRPNEVHRLRDDLITALARDRPVDELVALVVAVAEVQFPGLPAWVVSLPGGEPPIVRGRSPLDDAVVSAAVGLTRERAKTVGEGRFWARRVRDDSGATLGLLVVGNSRRGADPSPYDEDVLDRTARLAALVLGREAAGRSAAS